MRKRKTFTDAIRRAILDAKSRGLSRYRLGDLADVSQSTLSNFTRGRQGISSDLLDRIAPILGLRLVVDDVRQWTAKKSRKAKQEAGDGITR